MLNLILTGNPNTGKTTIFNLLTKSNNHVGNWHGVTIKESEKKTKYFNVVDLAGLYSLNNTASLEEVNAVNYLKEHSQDLIINVVDANNLQRNLFLTTQLISAGYKVCLLVNFTNDLNKSGKKINYEKLSEKLNIPVVTTNGKNRNKLIKDILAVSFNKTNNIKCLESEEEAYKFIEEILNYSIIQTKPSIYGLSKLDKFLLNKYLAIPIFVALLILIFYLTFSSVGQYLTQIIRDFFLNISKNSAFLQIYLKNNSPTLYNFVNECLINGVCNVVSFLPQIVILNIGLNLLEETGYIARIAFMFDDLLSGLGLSGKGMFTLLMGLGCSATAITTSSNMQNSKTKNKLALLTPNISCSAKLPIYTIIGSAFFGVNNIFIIVGLYFLGVAILTIQAFIYNKINPTQETFILEFPPLRIPNIKRVLINSIKTCVEFLLKAGSVILIFSCIVWLLQHFTYDFKYTNEIDNSLIKAISQFILPVFIPLGFYNWGIVASLITGIASKEMVISTISILNKVELNNIASSLTNPLSVVSFNAKTAIVFLIFCLIYTPCMATYAMQKNISGRKIAILSMIIQFITAYVVCMLAQTILSLLSFWQGVIALVLVILLLIIVSSFKRKKTKCNGNCSNCTKCILN